MRWQYIVVCGATGAAMRFIIFAAREPDSDRYWWTLAGCAAATAFLFLEVSIRSIIREELERKDSTP